MGITATFSHPLYLGGALSSEVPGLFPVAIDGHAYLIDLKSGDFKRQSLPLLRGQADTGTSPGEASLNPDDLWRRVQETWHKGAGQVHRDREESDAARFRSSRGIDVWTKWQLSLLKDTILKEAATDTNLYLAVAGSQYYFSEGQTVRHAASATTVSWTDCTGEPAAAVVGMASDGYNTYVSFGASGLYTTNTGTNALTSFITGNVGIVRVVKGRVMVSGLVGTADQHKIYNITTALGGAAIALGAATATVLFAHRSGASGFRWVDFAEGQGVIYAAGYSGDKSTIYKTTAKADGTALDEPTVAGELPDGEIVRCIQGYLGYLVVGTDLGVRFATADGQGNLMMGPLLRTGRCECFEPQDRFVWFGWNNYSATHTGLGRMDLSTFTAPMTPAYATDLMALDQGAVQSVVTFFQGGVEYRLFTVSGKGMYVQSPNYVASGEIESGLITYGIYDKKFGMFLDVRTEPLLATSATGGYEVFASFDGATYVSLGESRDLASLGYIFQVGQKEARDFEFKLVVTAPTTLTTTDVFTRLTFRAYPAPSRVEAFTVPLLMYETLDFGSMDRHLDVQAEIEYLIGIANDRRLVTYQDPGGAHIVLIEDYEFQPHHMTTDRRAFNGTLLLRLKTVTE